MEKNQIIAKYKEHVLEEGEPPASVYKFSKNLDIPEREFFAHFASFEAIDAAIWRQLVADAVSAIGAGAEWDGFNAQQKQIDQAPHCSREGETAGLKEGTFHLTG